MPRPSKLSAQVQEKIVAALRVGATYEHAALVAGVSYDSFRRWMLQGERDSHGRFCEFCQAIKRAEAEAAVRWLARIEQAANDGAWQAAAWKLERRYPEQWGRRDRMEVKHAGTLDITMLANMRAAILSAVEDVPTRVRIAEALLALDGEDGEGGDGGDGGGDRERSA